MDLNQYLEKMEEIVIQPMISFMDFCDEDDCEYTLEDVQTCKDLISVYLEKLACMEEPEDEAIMEQVKVLVLALNELNEKTDYVLIFPECDTGYKCKKGRFVSLKRDIFYFCISNGIHL